MLVQDWLSAQAKLRPDTIALIENDQQWTYQQLNQAVATLAQKLIQFGIEPQQRVAVRLPNGFNYVCLIHALARIRAIVVPLNTRLTEAEHQQQVEQSRCEILIDDAHMQTINAQSTKQTLPESSIDTTATSAIVYTSGTTGTSKGVKISHDNFLWSAIASGIRLQNFSDDRWLLCMPLYHVGGLSIVWRCCLYGTAVVLNPFEPESVHRALHQHRVTLISLVPTMLYRLIDLWKSEPPPESLRCMLLGGAATPLSLIEEVLSMNLPIALTYGLTEAASQVATASPEKVRQKSGTVGPPLAFTSVSILDENHQPLPANDIGHIAVRGPMVMQGYDHQSEITQQVLKDDLLLTGDLGYLDEDGDLWMVNRREDLIITGGENVYPSEVETVLLQHPNIQEACVVGLPDEEWGQKVCAALVLVSSDKFFADELKIFLESRLATYKQPRQYHILKEFPKTASGKIERSQLLKQIQPPLKPES